MSMVARWLEVVLVSAVLAAGVQAGPAPDGDRVPAGLTVDDVRVLGEARAYLEPMAADEEEPDYVRSEAVWALNRIHEALGDWDRPGLLAWYVDLLLSPSSERFRGPLLAGAEVAARAGQYHLGGVRAFWRDYEASVQADGRSLDETSVRARTTFEDRAKRLERPTQDPSRRLRTLQIRPPKIDVGRHLKPYPEPKTDK